MRWKLEIAYQGTHYGGWQVQPNAPSIQEWIQKSLEKLLRHPIALSGAGRTDAGVHALGQTAHFDSSLEITAYRLCRGLNALLPPDIRILSATQVPSDFHARYSAIAKTYRYSLQLKNTADPISRLYRTPLRSFLYLDRVREATTYLVGTHDFLSFANRSALRGDTIRTLFRIDIAEEPMGGCYFEFEGNGFLYKMVRNLTGLLLEIGFKKKEASCIPDLFANKMRNPLIPTAPAEGLCLMKVHYPEGD